MADTYTVTVDTNGLFVGFFQALTNFINTYWANGITMQLSAPGPSPGAPISANVLNPSGGNIVAGTAQPAPTTEPTITVTSAGGTSNRFAVTNDTPATLGFFNSLFLTLTNFINANYASGITMELSAPGGPYPPIEGFGKTFYMVTGTAFPAPAEPTITLT
jgi:hypothetical protein